MLHEIRDQSTKIAEFKIYGEEMSSDGTKKFVNMDVLVLRRQAEGKGGGLSLAEIPKIILLACSYPPYSQKRRFNFEFGLFLVNQTAIIFPAKGG